MPSTAAEWSDHVRYCAEQECRGSSPLYEAVGLSLAEDHDLLEWLAAATLPGASVYLLFATVHYLLMREAAANQDSTAPLRSFYPSLTRNPLSPAAAYPAFRAFCESERDRIATVLATRTVQTNEVSRCTFLLPAFVIASDLAGKPLHLIDVGAAAGLNLLFDRYGYDYGPSGRAGVPGSPVQLHTDVRGAPLAIGRMPPIAGRVGIDLNPIDPADRDAGRWLEACIWPEHADRLRNLRAALSIAHDARPRVISADAIEGLPSLVAEADPDAAVVVFTTSVLQYFPLEARARFGAALAEVATGRELFWVAAEAASVLTGAGFTASLAAVPPGQGALPLVMSRFANGRREDRVLARVGPHARWLEWYEA